MRYVWQCGQTNQNASVVASKPVKAMLSTVPREARATPAFALLKWEPDGDGDGTDPESCPESAPGWGIVVEYVVVVCVAGESGNAAIAAD